MHIFKKLSPFIFLLPIFLFVFLLTPYVDLRACWDGGTEYSKITTFYGLGMDGYLRAGSLHPPFKAFIAYPFFKILGDRIISYHIMGIVVGCLAILSMYFLGKKLWNKQVGLLAATLLATCPLFLANATDNYTDYFVAVFVIVSLVFYANNRLIFYAIAASAATLSKDTGLLLPVAVLITEVGMLLLKKHVTTSSLLRIVWVSLPVLSYAIWYIYVKTSGIDVFNDYIFAATAHQGAIITILTNLITLNFFHKYAQAHMLQLLFLNFTWVYWLILIIGGIVSFQKITMKKLKHTIKISNQNTKTITAMILFFVGYILTVVTFQIWNTPRYNLPLIPLLIIAASVVLVTYKNKIPTLIFLLLAGINFAAIYYSVDPVSTMLWNRAETTRQTFYTIDPDTLGNDNLVYNLQYVQVMKKRDMVLPGNSSKTCNFTN